MKTVYLIRHGMAVELGERGVKQDADRMLSAEGRKKTERVARGLRALDITLDRLVASPLVRAAETAALVAHRVAPRLRVETHRALAPETSAARAAAWLARQRFTAMALVGHSPHLENLASHLLGGKPPVRIALKKAGVCCLTFAGKVRPGRAQLEWLLQPAQLSRIRS